MGVCPLSEKDKYLGDFPNFSLIVKSKISIDADKYLFDYQYNNDEESYNTKIST